jgi:acyl-CoA thioester hydrolase
MERPHDRPVHVSRVRVRYAETDRMGVAYYANFLVWFEVARTDFLRQHGLSYRDLEAQGCLLPVGEVALRLLAPARYDDELAVECWLEQARSRCIVFGYRVLRNDAAGETLLAGGTTSLLSVDPQMVPRRLPAAALSRLCGLAGS